MFVDVHPLGDGSGKFQRVELGLTGKFYPACHREGQGQLAGEFPGKSQTVQGVQLSLNIPQVIPGVDVRVRFFIVAVNLTTKRSVSLQRLFLGGQISFGSLVAKPAQEFVVDEAVLDGEFGGGILGDAAADGVCLCQYIRHPGLMQLVGAQKPRHASADNEYIGLDIPVQAVKVVQLCGLFP